MHQKFILTLLWGAALLTGVHGQRCRPRRSPAIEKFTKPLDIPEVLVPKVQGWIHPNSSQPMDFYEVTIKPTSKKIFDDIPGETDLLGYNGQVPGPTIKVTKGTETVVRFVNEDSMEKVVHLHGSYSRAVFDGWAEDFIPPGHYKDYYYPNKQSARPLWYHDHADPHTELHVRKGLAGFYFIEDPALEEQFKLPAGDYNIPLMLGSHLFTADGQIQSLNNLDHGDVFTVNGMPWPFLNVQPRKYRFQILNASSNRHFILSFNSTSGERVPMTVVGSDGGYSSRSVDTETLIMGMAERYTVVFDFTDFAGQNVTLAHNPLWGNNNPFRFDSEYFTLANCQGEHITNNVMQFRVSSTPQEDVDQTNNGPVPRQLVPREEFSTSSPDHIFTFDNSLRFDGTSFMEDNRQILRNVPRGTVEQWRFAYQVPSTQNLPSHPIHVHLIDFEILARGDSSRGVPEYEQVAVKDVVNMSPGDSVDVAARFAPWPGVYMMHCHNTFHEDQGMMAGFNVTKLLEFGYDETTIELEHPLDPDFAAKPFVAPATTEEIENVLLPHFGDLRAYENPAGVLEALEEYHATRIPTPTGFPHTTGLPPIPTQTGA